MSFVNVYREDENNDENSSHDFFYNYFNRENCWKLKCNFRLSSARDQNSCFSLASSASHIINELDFVFKHTLSCKDNHFYFSIKI